MVERLNILLEKQLAGNLSRSEHWELMGLILEPALQHALNAFLEKAWSKTGSDHAIKAERMEMLFKEVFENRHQSNNNGETVETQVIEMVSAKRGIIGWKRWTVAASILAILGLGSYLFIFDHKANKPNAAVTVKATDIKAPQKTKAIITLADGRKISLDSLSSIRQEEVQLTQTADGKIIYSGTSNKIAFNTLTNPRGSKIIHMILADGSRVWLNAGSSVTYPVAFIGSERKVEITGEAYFEIKHNTIMPFVVSKGEMSVKVLGTHFNVNAYDDEIDIKVTLLEGSVKVNRGGANSVLKPGQQARITTNIGLANNVDLEEVMAWKNGKFLFNNTDLKEIMRQLGRWYDVEIVYEGNVQDRRFTGKVLRNVNASTVLAMLEYAGIQFRMEGNKIIVLK